MRVNSISFGNVYRISTSNKETIYSLLKEAKNYSRQSEAKNPKLWNYSERNVNLTSPSPEDKQIIDSFKKAEGGKIPRDIVCCEYCSWGHIFTGDDAKALNDEFIKPVKAFNEANKGNKQKVNLGQYWSASAGDIIKKAKEAGRYFDVRMDVNITPVK